MTTSADPIRVSTTPVFRDYLRFLMWFSFRQVRLLIPFAIFAIVAFLLAPLVPFEEKGAIARYRAALGTLILPAIVFVFLPISNYLAGKKRWKAAIALRAPRVYVFSESGIEVIAETFHSEASWKHVVSAYQQKGQVMLGTAQRQFYLVPMAAFESPAQRAEFLDLVKRNVPACKL